MDTRKDSWFTLSSGRRFYPFDPNPDDITIEDIALALSHLCRYNGHSKKFYCTTPDTRVLTADLRWIPSGDVRIGDALIGFDEHSPKDMRRARRKLKPALVTHAAPIKRRVYRIVLSDGSELKSSEEHPWLASTKKAANQKWCTTADISDAVAAGRPRHLPRFLSPWKEITGDNEGYIRGLFDGEGHVTSRGSSLQVGFSQNRGPVLDMFRESVRAANFQFSDRPNSASDVQNINIKGGWAEQFRLLGTFRPVRLLTNFSRWVNTDMSNKEFPRKDMVKVEAVEYLGEKEVAGIETTSHTYFAEGFGAHNSVAEHSVHCSNHVASGHELTALMHDATEAYVGDMIRPIKMFIPDFKEMEDLVWGAVASKFGLPVDMPKEVHVVDNLILVTEARDLLGPGLMREWGLDIDPIDTLDIDRNGREPWSSAVAHDMFMSRFDELYEAPQD